MSNPIEQPPEAFDREQSCVQKFVRTSIDSGVTSAIVELNTHIPPLTSETREEVIRESLDLLADLGAREEGKAPEESALGEARNLAKGLSTRRKLGRGAFKRLRRI